MFKQNDILVNGKDKRKVLGVCGEVIFTSCANDMVSPTVVSWRQKELESAGWTLEEKKWKPKSNESYWYVSSCGLLGLSKWFLDSGDYFRQQTGNCFPYTDEGRIAAEAYREKLIKVMGGGE